MENFVYTIATKDDQKEVCEFFLKSIFDGVHGETFRAAIGVDPTNEEVIRHFNEDVENCLRDGATVLARDANCWLA